MADSQRFCFRYDGSDDAKEAWDLWNGIRKTKLFFPVRSWFYYSDGYSSAILFKKTNLFNPFVFTKLMKKESTPPTTLNWRDIRFDLEQKIKQLVDDFESQTGAFVSEIKVGRIKDVAPESMISFGSDKCIITATVTV